MFGSSLALRSEFWGFVFAGIFVAGLHVVFCIWRVVGLHLHFRVGCWGFCLPFCTTLAYLLAYVRYLGISG